MNVPIPRRGRSYLKLYYHLRHRTELLPAGHLLGFDEILLETEDNRNQDAIRLMSREARSTEWETNAAVTVQETDAVITVQETDAAITVQETETDIVCTGRNFVYTYDKHTGLFSQINYAGKDHLNRPMELNIWRTPTDNDMYAL